MCQITCCTDTCSMYKGHEEHDSCNIPAEEDSSMVVVVGVGLKGILLVGSLHVE